MQAVNKNKQKWLQQKDNRKKLPNIWELNNTTR
jgi:hypothetical protein